MKTTSKPNHQASDKRKPQVSTHDEKMSKKNLHKDKEADVKTHKLDSEPVISRLYEASGHMVELNGMLASVSGAFVVFLLSPGLFPNNKTGIDWQLVIVLLIIATSVYTLATASSVWIRIWRGLSRVRTFWIFSFTLFAIGNLLLLGAITSMLRLFELFIAFYTALAILIITCCCTVLLIMGFRVIIFQSNNK